MARREFLMLAKTYQPTAHKVGGWYLSEKLDGTRCFWDGGLSRGIPTNQVPWAGTLDPKSGKLKKKLKPIATGLWSRYGNPIIATDSFLDQLPAFPCDGELWAGRGKFQLCRSICAKDDPDPRFEDNIQFAVFSSPAYESVFQDGIIRNANMIRTISTEKCMNWVYKHAGKLAFVREGSTFEQELFALLSWTGWTDRVYVHKQTILPIENPEVVIKSEMDKLLADGAEGVVIRDPHAQWTPRRVASVLKYKPWHDDEATLVGFTSGRLTTKGSRNLGKIGALITEYKGKRLELSGMNDLEREFETDQMRIYAEQHPGMDMPDWFEGKLLKTGDQITFKYRELSDAGIPKDARFWRQR